MLQCLTHVINLAPIAKNGSGIRPPIGNILCYTATMVPGMPDPYAATEIVMRA